MSNGYFNKQTAGQKKSAGNGPKLKRGPSGSTSMNERTAAWPDVSPHWGTSFNRSMKAPVVKTGVVRKGVD